MSHGDSSASQDTENMVPGSSSEGNTNLNHETASGIKVGGPTAHKRSNKLIGRFSGSSRTGRFGPILFILLIAGLGTYFLVGANAQDLTITVQAESLTRARATSIVNDSNASGGSALKFASVDPATGNFTLPGVASKLTVRARENYCQQHATYSVTIDGQKVASGTVTSGSWADYPTTGLTLAAGQHNLQVSMGNPYKYKRCSRALFVDKIDFLVSVADPTPTPPPSTTPPPPGTTPPPPTTVGSNPLTDLQLIPWEGGSAYWNQFPIAKSAGWADPSFFPIGIWFNGMSSNAEAQFDKDHGINSYFGMWEGTPYNLFADNGLYWIGSKLNDSFPDNGTNWVGHFIDDEPDGKHATMAEDYATFKSEVDAMPQDGRFGYANFTQIVIGDYGASNNAFSSQLVNSYAGPSSVDMYYYTIPNCEWSYSWLAVPHDPAHCKTSSSYGKTMKSLRNRDAVDGQLKPLWQFVEDLNGGPPEGPFTAYITPGQLKGAVIDSIINEARGIFYFNQSFSGTCTGTAMLRQSQYDQSCQKPQMDAMKEVNSQIKALAPVLNTQSYSYNFGTNLDTMLKWYNGSAYIFAMVSGDATSQPGNRTFTMPSGLSKAASVEVVNEARTIPVTNGSFTDNFAQEYSYHIYKVTP